MPRDLTAPTKKTITVAPVRSSAVIHAWYLRRLDAMIARMQLAVYRAVRRAYRANPPEMAADASPASELSDVIAKLAREWERNFASFASETSRMFARRTQRYSDTAFRAHLKKVGFTVEFRMTPAARDVMQATIAEQVGLIRSIPSEYLTQVQGDVMRSVQSGRDLASLTDDIWRQYGVTRRRAEVIARDQNNKATASMNRVRQTELGITHAVWLHSAGGKVPRRTHVAASGKQYEIAKGMWDSDERKFVLPGELINCRCVCRSVIPGIG